MRTRIITGLFAGGLILAGVVGLSTGSQAASRDVDPSVAVALDSANLVFVRHNRAHRMWEIQRSQRFRGGYGPGYRRGYIGRPGYGHGYRGRYQGIPGWAGRPGY